MIVYALHLCSGKEGVCGDPGVGLNAALGQQREQHAGEHDEGVLQEVVGQLHVRAQLEVGHRDGVRKVGQLHQVQNRRHDIEVT
jgi:hypothetical protein